MEQTTKVQLPELPADYMKPEFSIDLNGPEGNIFMVIAKAKKYLQAHGYKEFASQLADLVAKTGPYEEALEVINHFCEVEYL